MGVAVGHAQGVPLTEGIAPYQAHHPGGGVAAAVVIGGAHAGTDRGDQARCFRFPIGAEAQVVGSGHFIAGIGIDQSRAFCGLGVGVGKGHAPVLGGIAHLSRRRGTTTKARHAGFSGCIAEGA